MSVTGETEPKILLFQAGVPMDEYVGSQDFESRVYVPIRPEELADETRQYTLAEMVELVEGRVTSTEEIEMATDALKLLVASGFGRARIPVLYDFDDDTFYAAVPGKSSGEEMTETSILKTRRATKKRRDG